MPAAVCACFAVSSLTAQPPANLDQLLAARAVAALQESGVPSVSIAVADHDSLIYAKANPTAGRDAETVARYAVGSIGKQFTAAAILLLEEQGKLSLEDKVAKFFPA